MTSKKHFLFTGQKFGDWEVIDPKVMRQKNYFYILCYDNEANILRYVEKYSLIHGHTKGAFENLHKKRLKNNTYRTKNILPTHIYPIYSKNTIKQYKVAIKRKNYKKGKQITFGYFHSIFDAIECVKNNVDKL